MFLIEKSGIIQICSLLRSTLLEIIDDCTSLYSSCQNITMSALNLVPHRGLEHDISIMLLVLIQSIG